MEVYQIAVKLAMTSNAPQFLSLLSSQILGVNAKVSQLTGNFNRLHAAIGGGIAIAAGSAMLAGMNKIADKGKELLHQQELMRIAGWKNKEVTDALAKAWQVSGKITTTTASENLKHIRELAYATGDLKDAMAILEPVTKANAVLNGLKGGGTDQVFELVKALESKGLATAEERKNFLGYINGMIQASEASGGRVTPQMFMSTFKYSRTAKFGWDQEFITQILPRLMQEWATGGSGGGSGSGGPGNALMTGFSQMVSGVMSKTAAQALTGLGLATMTHQKGTTKAYTHVKDVDLFIRNPYEWVQRDLMPQLIGRYGHNEQKIIEALGVMFPTRTWGSAIAEFALQGRAFKGSEASPYEKDRRLALKAMGVDAAYAGMAGNDPNQIMLAYAKQEAALWEALGPPIMKLKIEVLKAITPFVTSLAQFAQQNPETIKQLGIGIGVLGAALIGGGAIAIIAALGPAGWIAAGIIGLAGAIQILNPEAFKSIVKDFRDFAAGIASLRTMFDKPTPELLAKEQEAGKRMLIAMADSFMTAMQGLPALVMKPMQDTINKLAYQLHDAIAAALSNAFSSIGNWLGGLFHRTGFTGGSFSGGFTRASYSPGGSWNGGLGPVNTGWNLAGASPQDRASYIMATARSLGIDPRVALRVAQSEGFYSFTGDSGWSHGDFQLYSGGGLGNAFRAATGLNPSDPKNWKAMDLFALQWAAKHGWGAFHGAARVGIGSHQGIGHVPPPPPKINHGNGGDIVLHLDGREIARATSKHLARMHEHPTAAPYFDSWRSYSPPDMQTVTT